MKKPVLALTLCALISTGSVFAAQPPRDNFYWLGQINKASDVINTDEGLLTPEEGHAFAKGIDKVLRDGNLPGAPRPRNVVAFEPYLIKAAGPDVTKIHAGRSSQDMLTTVGIMEQREHLLTMAKKLNKVQADFIRLAEENKDTLIPNYTNGVAAQPNSLAHYFIAYANASTLLGMSVEAMFRSHNIPAGMADGRLNGARDIMPEASKVLTSMDKILNNLVIDPARSLEELNLDWTCSQEIADELMKNHGIPFRMGHHFASEIVTYARAHHITPRDFTYEDAKAVYAKVSAGDPNLPRSFPMTEEEWNHAKDPASIVRNRKVKGGPQPAELDKMIQMAKEELADNKAWTEETEKKLASAEQKLNQDFNKLL